ncbi:MAG TPA: DNA primase, partial [Candidatus Limnocylindrales bacterium]|nr:DNA primase [Candidatus Limnocylindrales bacterium]
MAAGAAAEVKSRLNIVDVVGETVELRKAGTTFKGLCPFHGEKTPSFVVTPGRDTWKCFGCGKGGDVFTFVMERDGVTFPEALRVLAGRAGVELDERSRRDDARKARLREVLETAIAFYHSVLTASKTGQAALDYLRGRGFTDETIERFQLGFAPGGWDQMSRRLIDKRDVRPEELLEVGLATAGRRGPIDKFRERVIFPIRDASANAVGLGGRSMPGATDPRAPKYLNSAATPLFDKSRTLYLIDRAKGAMRKSGQAVLVEGYTDALMAHQAGFDNVVASLGTALTPGQVAILARYASRIALAYDVDPAGQSAGTFGVTELTALISEVQAVSSSGRGELGLTDVGVVRLPDGKDPDEVVRDTPDLWREAVRTPAPILAYLIDTYAARVDTRTADGRSRLVAGVVPTLRQVADPTVRDGYVRLLAQRAAVDDRVIVEALAASARARSGTSPADAHTGTRLTLDAVKAAGEGIAPDAVLRAITPVEAELLRLLLLVPDQQVRVVDELAPDQLPSALARELFRAIVLAREPSEAGLVPAWDRDAFLAALDEETYALALALYARRGPDPSTLSAGRLAYQVNNALLDLEADRIRERSDFNRAAQADAERRDDRSEIAALLAQERTINEERRSLDRRREQARLLARGSGAGASGGASGAA